MLRRKEPIYKEQKLVTRAATKGPTGEKSTQKNPSIFQWFGVVTQLRHTCYQKQPLNSGEQALEFMLFLCLLKTDGSTWQKNQTSGHGSLISVVSVRYVCLEFQQGSRIEITTEFCCFL